MARRGPSPKPTALKVLAGNPGKRALPKEPVAPGRLIEAPSYFTAQQRRYWAEALADAPRGILKRIDASALEAWCTARDAHRRAVVAMNRRGITIKSKDGVPRRAPWMSELFEAQAAMRGAIDRLGFAPSARPRLGPPQSVVDEGIAENLAGLQQGPVEPDLDDYLASNPSRPH